MKTAHAEQQREAKGLQRVAVCLQVPDEGPDLLTNNLSEDPPGVPGVTRPAIWRNDMLRPCLSHKLWRKFSRAGRISA